MWRSVPHVEPISPLQIRSFTSKSYRAMKERERKYERRKTANNVQQQSEAQNDVLSKSAFASTRAEIPHKGCESNEVTVLDSGHWQQPPLIIHDDRGSLLDSNVQEKVTSQGAASMRALELQHADDALHVPVTATTTTHSGPPSGRLEIVPGTELDHESVEEPSRDSDTTCEEEPQVITINDSSVLSLPQLGNDGPSSCKLLALYSSAACSTTDDYSTCQSPTQVHKPEVAKMDESLITALAAESAVGALDMDCTVQPCTSEATSTTGRTIEEPWTTLQDELLVHLREIAQLQWREVGKYYPKTKLSAVQRRYSQLTTASKSAYAKHMPRLGTRNGAASVRLSSYEATSKGSKRHYTALRSVAALPVKDPGTHRRKLAKQAKDIKAVECTAPSICDEKQPASRCGRPIRHPFRHRRSEGYI